MVITDRNIIASHDCLRKPAGLVGLIFPARACLSAWRESFRECPLSKLPLTPHWSELNHMPISRAEIGLLLLRFKESLPEREGG